MARAGASRGTRRSPKSGFVWSPGRRVRGLRDGRRSWPARKLRRLGWMATRPGYDDAGAGPASGLIAIDQRVGNPHTERMPPIDRINTI